MSIADFCARHASDCAQQAEACDDAERRQAWLRLAKEWVQVGDGIVALKRGGARPAEQPRADTPA
jgi:hypothetical protein